MPSSRPRPTWARPLSAVPCWPPPCWPRAPTAAAADAKPEITVTPSENLAAGTEISVQGTGFEPETLLFVAVCDSAKPLGSACDTGNYAKATTGADGTLSTKLKVVPTFGDTDCAKTSCALMTNDPADPKSTRNYVTASLTFTGGGARRPRPRSPPRRRRTRAAPAASCRAAPSRSWSSRASCSTWSGAPGPPPPTASPQCGRGRDGNTVRPGRHRRHPSSAAAMSSSSASRRHALRRSPMLTSSGISCAQRSTAYGQRGWNAHPAADSPPRAPPGQHRQLAPGRIGLGDRGQQRSRVGVPGRGEDLLGRTPLHHAPQVQTATWVARCRAMSSSWVIST